MYAEPTKTIESKANTFVVTKVVLAAECIRLLKIRQYKRILIKLKLGLLPAFRLSLMSFSNNRFGHVNPYLEF